MGGGALLEGGVHWVNLLLNVGGAPAEVIAAKPEVTYPPAAPFEDNLELLVKFDGGAVGKLLHSWRTHNRIAGLSASKLYGTDGNITFESNGLWAVVLGNRKRIRIPGLLDIMGYRGMLKAFAQSVRDGTPPPMSLKVAKRDMELIFAAYRSLESKRFEPVPR
jgi:predicted dehydrogenase